MLKKFLLFITILSFQFSNSQVIGDCCINLEWIEPMATLKEHLYNRLLYIL